jgi:hypothetical protein
VISYSEILFATHPYKTETQNETALLLRVREVSGQYLGKDTDSPTVRFTVIPFSLSTEVLG